MRVVSVATVALLISLVSSSNSQEDPSLSPFEGVTRGRIIDDSVPSPKELQERILGKKTDMGKEADLVDSQQTEEIVLDMKGKDVLEEEIKVKPPNLDRKSEVSKPTKKLSSVPQKVLEDRGKNQDKKMVQEKIEKNLPKKTKKNGRKSEIVTKAPATLSGCAKATLKVFVAIGVTVLIIEGITYVLDPTHTASMWVSETVSSFLQSLPSLETISGWVGSLFSSTKISPPQLIEEVYVCNPGRCLKYSVCVETIKEAIKEGGASCYKAAECVSAIINTAGRSCYQNVISGSGGTCNPTRYISGKLGM